MLDILGNLFERGRLLSLQDYSDVLELVKKWKKLYVLIAGDPNFVEKPEEFRQMLAELEQSIRTSTSNEEITSEEALRRFKDLDHGISRLISSSPWGAYLRWNELKINEQTLIEYLAPAIQKVRESGGQAFLLLVNQIFRTALE